MPHDSSHQNSQKPKLTEFNYRQKNALALFASFMAISVSAILSSQVLKMEHTGAQLLFPKTTEEFALQGKVYTPAELSWEGVEVSGSSQLDPVKEPSEPIQIFMAGDIMLGRYIKTLMSQREGDFPFTYMDSILYELGETMATDPSDISPENPADFYELVVGNLEGPITDSNYVNPGTAMRFDFEPETAQLLLDHHFTTLSQANNHTHDQGYEGHLESISRLQELGIGAFGHPDTHLGEFSTTTYKINDVHLTFLGLNDADYKLNKEAVLEEIAKLNDTTDFLIVSVHWGIEYEFTARSSISDFAHQMVDAGADFIHGHHPHVVQNRETYNGVPIYYSLGNFIFDQYWASYVQEGLVVGLTLQKRSDGSLYLDVKEMDIDIVDLGAPKPSED